MWCNTESVVCVRGVVLYMWVGVMKKEYSACNFNELQNFGTKADWEFMKRRMWWNIQYCIFAVLYLSIMS